MNLVLCGCKLKGGQEAPGRAGEEKGACKRQAQPEQRPESSREQGLFEAIVLNIFAKFHQHGELPDARDTVTGLPELSD